MDFLVPIIKYNKFNIFIYIIKIAYILTFIFNIPYSIFFNDIFIPTFLGNISIFFASLTALIIIDIQTRIYKHNHKY